MSKIKYYFMTQKQLKRRYNKNFILTFHENERRMTNDIISENFDILKVIQFKRRCLKWLIR